MAAPSHKVNASPSGVVRHIESVSAERQALGVLAILALAAMLAVVRPVIIGFVLGTITAFTLQPFYERLKTRTGRPRLAASLCVLGSTFASVTIVATLFSLFFARGSGMAQALALRMAPGGSARVFAEKFAMRLGPFELQPEELTAKLHGFATELASRATNIAGHVASATFGAVLAIGFAMMTLYYILQNWTSMAARAEEMMPIRPEYTRTLLVEFQRVGRTTLLGTLLAGIGQGVFAGMGYAICRVPEATFLGAATAVASLVPGVGTLLIWIPAGAYLFSTGHPAMGVLELVWGSLVVVGLTDYWIRPRMVGGDGPMPVLLTYAALFGGIEVFGLTGLIFGPLIMSVSFVILGLFAKDAEERRKLGERHA